MVDLVVLACVFKATTKKGKKGSQLLCLSPNIFLLNRSCFWCDVTAAVYGQGRRTLLVDWLTDGVAADTNKATRTATAGTGQAAAVTLAHNGFTDTTAGVPRSLLQY